MGRKYIRMKGGGYNALKFAFNEKELLIIPTDHTKRELSIEDLKKIVDIGETKRNVCYLLELDKRLNKNEIRRLKKGDFTTKMLMPYFEKAFKEMYYSKCIKGWDNRQTLIGQEYQNKIYHNAENLTLGEIVTKYINRFPKLKKIDLSKYEDKIGKYLDNEYKNIFTNNGITNGGVFDWIYENIKKNVGDNWGNITIKEFMSYHPMTKRAGIDLINNLRIYLMALSDLEVLEKILEKSNKTNYIIFVGYKHYENMKNHLKNMEII